MVLRTGLARGATAIRQRAHKARARPRRKRNEDGGVPPMDLTDPETGWPDIILSDPIEAREELLKDHP